MRKTTERTEGVDAGVLKLVGTKKDDILKEAQGLLDDNKIYERISKAQNPFGDGKAAERIVDILTKNLMPGGIQKSD
jgi:UDP-N-acetylglucosamine 2-epimerase (non-hydrolysing)